MTLYLDASALVKRYIAESGTSHVVQAIAEAEFVGTSVVTRAETAAALAKAVRVGVLEREEGHSALRVFRENWPDLVRIHVTETVIARADTLAWDFGLRGYDAVQLASALQWKNGMNEDVTFATFNRQLWEAAGQSDLTLFTSDLPQMLAPNGERTV